MDFPHYLSVEFWLKWFHSQSNFNWAQTVKSIQTRAILFVFIEVVHWNLFVKWFKEAIRLFIIAMCAIFGLLPRISIKWHDAWDARTCWNWSRFVVQLVLGIAIVLIVFFFVNLIVSLQKREEKIKPWACISRDRTWSVPDICYHHTNRQNKKRFIQRRKCSLCLWIIYWTIRKIWSINCDKRKKKKIFNSHLNSFR